MDELRSIRMLKIIFFFFFEDLHSELCFNDDSFFHYFIFRICACWSLVLEMAHSSISSIGNCIVFVDGITNFCISKSVGDDGFNDVEY